MMVDSDMVKVFFQEGLRRILSDESGEDTVEWAGRQLARLSTPTGGGEVLDIRQSIEFYLEVMRKREERFLLPADQRRELLFPWQTWNSRIDPLPGGMLTVIAGADGAGKTMYAECIVEWYARKGFKVALFHFELSHGVMMDRRASRWSGLTIRELKSPLNAEQKESVERAHREIARWSGNIQYVHCPGWTMESVVQKAKALHAEGLVDVIVVDYLEKASSSPKQLRAFGQSTFAREGDNVETLKNCAEMLDVPIITLSQLNKEGKQREFAQMDRTAIRGAGEKTEKANVVVLLSREKQADGDYSPVVDVRIDKNTLGPTGSFRQLADPPHFRIMDATFEEVQLPQGGGK